MKRVILIFITILFLPAALMSQSAAIDSLKNELKKANQDTTVLKILNGFSKEAIAKNYYHDVLHYADTVKIVAEKQLAAHRDNQEAQVIKRELARAIIYSGVANTFLGNYAEAMKNLFAALQMSEQLGYIAGMASCNNDIGYIYFLQGNNEDALKSYLAALKDYEALGEKHNISMCYNNISGIYINQGRFAEAMTNLLSSLQIRKSIGDSAGIAILYNNIGELYAKQDNHADALKNHLAALKIRETFHDRAGISMSYCNLGSAYIRLGNYKTAQSFLDSGLRIAVEINDKERIKDIYQILSKLYDKLNDYKNAFKYHSLYSDLKDSLFSEDNNKQIAEMKARYETEKKEKEIDLLNKDKELLNKKDEIKTILIERQKGTVRYLIAGFGLLLIFSGIAFWQYNQKRKTAFKHEVLETNMKALRAQMNPHFTFNVLNSIQYYVRANDMKAAEIYLNKFSKLIRLILDQSRSSYVLLKQEIAMLKLYLELEQMLFEEKFEYTINVDKDINTETIFIPGMLIQPVVENAIKHGLEHKEGEAIINISLSFSNSRILCSVTDNGIGREAAQKLKSNSVNSATGEASHASAGTNIIKERIDALSSLYNIQLKYTTEDLYDNLGAATGTCVLLEMPVNTNPAL